LLVLFTDMLPLFVCVHWQEFWDT